MGSEAESFLSTYPPPPPRPSPISLTKYNQPVYGSSRNTPFIDKLQKVQNAAARLVCKAKKSDHIHPSLETLHWLPVTHRIQYKISTICFNSISGTAPQYLSDLLQPYTPARQLRSASDTRTFVTPRVNTKTFGERSFSYAGPSVWNNLPQTLRHSDSTSSFKAALKTHLFNNYF